MAKAESPRVNPQSPKNGISPRNGLPSRNYSPRRQLIDTQKVQRDLEKSFEALRVQDAEAQKLYEYNRRKQNEKIDEKEKEAASYHENALRLEWEKREALSAEAEATLRRHHEQQIEEQRRRAEEERLRQQQEAQAQAERDRQIKEEQERLTREHEERARAEKEKARVEAERQRQAKERADAAEAERQRKAAQAKQEDDERKRREATQQAEAAEARQQADTRAQKTAAFEAAAQADNPGQIHQEYIALYHSIKTWKNNYWENIRALAKEHKNPQIKEAIGDARRLIKVEVGKQSYGDKDVNRMSITKIRACLRELLESPTPVIGTRLPVNNFLPPSLKLDDNDAATITDRAAYFLCILTQQVVKIFTSYVHGSPERAEPIGTMLASIFAQPELQFPRSDGTTQSLFPVFLAKYHRVCPALFGITADQSTSAGKLKMGWALLPSENDNGQKNTFISDDRHYDRMKGLAIGYSSFGLRNFSSTANKNPYPPTHFWRSLAQIVNLPPNQVQPTHVCVLRHMFGHGGIYRFFLFFGAVGVAVLREAFIEFPRRLPERMQQDSYVKELRIYVDNLGENEHLHLI